LKYTNSESNSFFHFTNFVVSFGITVFYMSSSLLRSRAEFREMSQEEVERTGGLQRDFYRERVGPGF
jgi:hypothetical protein